MVALGMFRVGTVASRGAVHFFASMKQLEKFAHPLNNKNPQQVCGTINAGRSQPLDSESCLRPAFRCHVLVVGVFLYKDACFLMFSYIRTHDRLCHIIGRAPVVSSSHYFESFGFKIKSETQIFTLSPYCFSLSASATGVGVRECVLRLLAQCGDVREKFHAPGCCYTRGMLLYDSFF
jgi:hypothetical protein